MPGPPGMWDSEWVNILASAICAEDIAILPSLLGTGGVLVGVAMSMILVL